MADTPQKYHLKILDPGDYSRWDHFVFESKGGTLFHTTSWARLIQSQFKRPFDILVAEDGSGIAGGILIFKKHLFGKSAVIQAPLTTYQGILLRTSGSTKLSSQIALHQDISALLIRYLKNAFPTIDMPLYPGLSDIRPFQWQGFQCAPAYTYIIPNIGSGEIRQEFSQALRRKISQSENEKLIVSESADPSALVRFVTDSYHHHHLHPPVRPNELTQHFSNLLEAGLGRIFYLEKEGKSLAGLMILIDRKTVYAYFAGIDREIRETHYTDYLHAAVMENSEFQNRSFDFSGANTQTLEQFKRSFGGSLHVYYRVSYSANYLVSLIRWLRRRQQLRRRQA